VYLLILILVGAFVSGLYREVSGAARSVAVFGACALVAVGFLSQRII
jgi:hypothetical protein